ncbi:hypothetical protein FB446DRAFT_793053 [Lentinula raphanica]|nr:hypothetical protein FB446DRAFT_793053 [Lentinula raphanica]
MPITVPFRSVLLLYEDKHKPLSLFSSASKSFSIRKRRSKGSNLPNSTSTIHGEDTEGITLLFLCFSLHKLSNSSLTGPSVLDQPPEEEESISSKKTKRRRENATNTNMSPPSNQTRPYPSYPSSFSFATKRFRSPDVGSSHEYERACHASFPPLDSDSDDDKDPDLDDDDNACDSKDDEGEGEGGEEEQGTLTLTPILQPLDPFRRLNDDEDSMHDIVLTLVKSNNLTLSLILRFYLHNPPSFPPPKPVSLPSGLHLQNPTIISGTC